MTLNEIIEPKPKKKAGKLITYTSALLLTLTFLSSCKKLDNLHYYRASDGTLYSCEQACTQAFFRCDPPEDMFPTPSDLETGYQNCVHNCFHKTIIEYFIICYAQGNCGC